MMVTGAVLVVAGLAFGVVTPSEGTRELVGDELDLYVIFSSCSNERIRK